MKTILLSLIICSRNRSAQLKKCLGFIDAGEMSFGRVLFYVADKNESFIDSFLEHFTACAAEELFFDDDEEEEPKEEDHCRGCMGACFGDCECCRHMKAGADDE